VPVYLVHLCWNSFNFFFFFSIGRTAWKKEIVSMNISERTS
jgi:hypothetical protein